jgi:glutaredoxin
MLTRASAGIVIAALAGLAAAQQMYRWTDENGRTHITDTPPPASAKGARKVKPPASSAEGLPYILQQAVNQFPVTLYTSAECTDPCRTAREHLAKRGVPFTETQIREGAEELKRVADATEVPALKVGGKVVSGYERAAYDGMLDSAGYPRTAVVPARKPEAASTTDPVKPDAAAPSGPYAPGARPQRVQPK